MNGSKMVAKQEECAMCGAGESERPLPLPTTNWSRSVNIGPIETSMCIPFQFNFFIKKEIILFLCFYGLMVKRFNKDESKRIKGRMCALSRVRACVCVCV